MIVDDEAIEAAILGIFIELRSLPEGRLPYLSLAQAWRGHNFRGTDLDDGISRMLLRGYLRLEDQSGNTMVALTAAGHRRCQALGSVGAKVRSRWRDFLAACGLRLPRLRRGSKGGVYGYRSLDLDDLERSARKSRRD